MTGPRKLAEGWLRKGDSDRAAGWLLAAGPGPWDTACYHAQQAVEKYLKALLAFRGELIARTHDLDELALLCGCEGAMQDLATLDLATLADYAVQLRYDPEAWQTSAEAVAALQIAERVRAAVLAELPFETPPGA